MKESSTDQAILQEGEAKGSAEREASGEARGEARGEAKGRLEVGIDTVSLEATTLFPRHIGRPEPILHATLINGYSRPHEYLNVAWKL